MWIKLFTSIANIVSMGCYKPGWEMYWENKFLTCVDQFLLNGITEKNENSTEP